MTSRTHAHARPHTRTHTNTHKHKQTHTHTHTHTQTHKLHTQAHTHNYTIVLQCKNLNRKSKINKSSDWVWVLFQIKTLQYSADKTMIA